MDISSFALQVEEGGWHRHKGELLLFLVLGVLDVHFRHLATSFILFIFTNLPNQTGQPSMDGMGVVWAVVATYWPFICCISYWSLAEGGRILQSLLIVEGFGKVERGGNATSRDNCCCCNPFACIFFCFFCFFFACNVKRNLFRLVCGCDWITLQWLHGQV